MLGEYLSLTAQKAHAMEIFSRVGRRLLIADDHAIFTEALRVYLEKTFTVVGVVMDGRAMVAEAMRLARM